MEKEAKRTLANKHSYRNKSLRKAERRRPSNSSIVTVVTKTTSEVWIADRAGSQSSLDKQGRTYSVDVEEVYESAEEMFSEPESNHQKSPTIRARARSSSVPSKQVQFEKSGSMVLDQKQSNNSWTNLNTVTSDSMFDFARECMEKEKRSGTKVSKLQEKESDIVSCKYEQGGCKGKVNIPSVF